MCADAFRVTPKAVREWMNEWMRAIDQAADGGNFREGIGSKSAGAALFTRLGRGLGRPAPSLGPA